MQFEMRLEFRRFLSGVNRGRPEFDRVAAIAIGLGPEKISGPASIAMIVRSNLGI